MTAMLILLLAPLAGALLVLMLPPRPALARAISSLAAAASLGAALALARGGHDAAGFTAVLRVPWLPTLGIDLHFGVDGVSAPLLVMTAAVGLAAVLAGGTITARSRLYHALLLFTLGACLGAFCSLDLFLLYVLCELATIPKFLLIALWGELPAGRYTRTPAYAAIQVTVFITTAALVILSALSLLYFAGGGHLDLLDLQARLAGHPIPELQQRWIFGLLALGFGVWCSLWPLHTWAPLTYAAAPRAASMLFAGVLKNAGAYALLRVALMVLPAGARCWAPAMAGLAIISILYAGWAAQRQKDWNVLITYGSISHMGYLWLALAVGGELGLTAAVFFMYAHGLVVALLFALTGALSDAAGSRFLHELGGLGRRAPFLAVAMTIAVVAGSGLPGSANFVAEVMVFLAAWQKGGLLFRVGSVVAVWGVVLTATYFFRALRATFHGAPARAEAAAAGDAASRPLRWAVALLVLALLIPGVWPRVWSDAVGRTLHALAAGAGEVAP